jgi:hypothetical protein
MIKIEETAIVVKISIIFPLPKRLNMYRLMIKKANKVQMM